MSTLLLKAVLLIGGAMFLVVAVSLLLALGSTGVFGSPDRLGAATTATVVTPVPVTTPEDGAIPASLLAVYQAAAAQECPSLPWPLLAAIGWVESRHADGQADPDTGQVSPPIYGPPLDGRDGRALEPDASTPGGYVRAEGPMQFLPSTWSLVGVVAPNRPAGARPDPQNAWDAIYSAARLLCRSGAAAGDLRQAVLAYNHSDAYLAQVWAMAVRYGMNEDGTMPTATTAASVTAAALASGSRP